MEETDWDHYGAGRNPKCAQCMAHCGYEPTAVNDTIAHPLKALITSLRGPRTHGPMAPDIPTTYTTTYAEHGAAGYEVTVPLSDLKRRSAS